MIRGGLLDAPGVAGAHPSALAALASRAGEWAERFPGVAGKAAWPLGPALREILNAAASERPLLITIDDAQWLDDGSTTAIEAIARDLARCPILVLLASSTEEDSPALGSLESRVGRDIPGTVLSLPLFDLGSLQQLARWAFPAYTEDQHDRLARRLAADSAGLPLLAVELCHAVSAGLDLEATAGAWPRPLRTLDQTRPGELPDTIVAAIRVGFRRLSQNAQATLTAAAILGDRVTPARLRKAVGVDGDFLDRALDELEWRRWLVADARGYTFVARIVRDVVERDMITTGQRQRILDAAREASTDNR
jgi:predicted ATPase